MGKSIGIVMTALLVLLMAGSAVGEVDITLATYDRNGDGVIDEDERVSLDIDIEAARIRVDESMFVGGYTTTGSLILTDDFVDYAFAGEQTDMPVAVEDPTPVSEPNVTVIEPEPTPVAPDTVGTPVQADEDEEPVATDLQPANQNTTPLIIGTGVALVAAAGAYMYYRRKDDTDDTIEKE